MAATSAPSTRTAARATRCTSARIAAEGSLGAMLPLALVQEVLVALGGLAFVCLVLAIFVLIARYLAPRLLGRDDGSSH